jgi:acetyl esterase/lipase
MGETARWETTHHDEVYLRRDGVDLLARVHRPAGAGAPGSGMAAVVEVHGGAWCDNDRRAGKLYNTALAAAGIVVAAVDFRQGPDHHHPAGSDDVAAAVGWTRQHAAELGVDPARVTLAGSSSGGHLALYAALHLDEPVAGVAALWPPTHPLMRYRYAQGKDDDHGRRLVANTLAYFVTEEAMLDAAIARVVRDGEHTNLPPVWLVHPTEDENVPTEITDDLVAAYRQAGGELDLWFVPGERHAFGHFPGAATDELVARFVAKVGHWTSATVA